MFHRGSTLCGLFANDFMVLCLNSFIKDGTVSQCLFVQVTGVI